MLRGPVTAREVNAALQQLATARGWRARQEGSSAVLVTSHAGAVLAAVRWRPGSPPLPGTLSHVVPPDQHLEILIDPGPRAEDAASLAAAALTPLTLCLSPAELAGLTASMPLTTRFATATPGTRFDGWALVFRDHYVEHSLGFVLAAGTAGIPPEWTLALAKGDRTTNRDRIHATLAAHGIRSGLLDNTALNAPATHAASLARSLEAVDAFTDAAHAAGRRVLVIDDGGLIAQGYGHAAARRQIDAAVELTVSGLKRIAAAGPLAVPVFNMARFQLKTRLGYPEIADSCLRRLREILPGCKFTGRPVVVLGFGALGSRLSSALASLGCQVHVVDTDPLAIIAAAESGHPTHRSAAAALSAAEPFLVAGTTGYDALTPADLRLLPDGCFLAPFATRDFALLSEPGISTTTTEIPGIGRRHALAAGPSITLLGDGRSLNLFEADSIPNQGYDAYRAGTLIAAAAHPAARVTVVDQYQHSAVLPELARLIAATEPVRPTDRITCTFAKDRTDDIARGRFIDRSYGVLGYEWLHMLAAIRHLIPPGAFAAYLSSAPGEAELQPAYDDRLFVSALAEHASVTVGGSPCRLELASTITGQLPACHRDGEPATAPVITPARIITAHAGETLFTARLAPATGLDGRQLPLNHHLITAERAGRVTHEQVITDSPMHTAIRHATRTLLSDESATPPDLSALRRIAAIAAALRTTREHEGS